MTIISELYNNAKTALQFRNKWHKWQVKLDKKAPKTGELAPDFTLFDVTGTKSVTLSDFRGKKPVALVFGSYT
jgi:peroxiredoxin